MSRPHHFSALDPDDPRADGSDRFASLNDDEFVRRFLEPATWRVLDFPETAWWGHLQFMFSLVDLLRPRRFVELGSHHGTSFFAANQAAQRLQLAMDAIAVDSWEGEEHTGRYDSSVFDGFCEVLKNRGYEQAIPLKMYFDDAMEFFEPESIDLLHIDGLHTFEAVQHDYQTWSDKVSPGGLILFHDINVHQKDFGVWRLWRELVDQAPEGRSFAFEHSHGLGVLQTDGDGFPQLTRLLEILHNDRALASHVQLMITSLSELAHLAGKLEPVQNAAVEHRSARRAAEAERNSLRKQLDAARRDVAITKKSLDEQRRSGVEKLAEQDRRAETRYGELAEAKSRLDGEAKNVRRRNQKLQSDMADLRLKSRLQAARAQREQARHVAANSRALELFEAEANRRVPTPSVLRRAVGKATGRRAPQPSRPDRGAVALAASEELLAGELVSSGLFDESYYVETYPDVVAYPEDPVWHFVRHGRFEDRQPNEFFDPKMYRERNLDVAARGVESCEHYLYFGSYELRHIGDTFDSPGYIKAYREVIDLGENALGNYLREGRDAGRSPLPQVDVGQETKLAKRSGSIDHAKDRATTKALTASYATQREAIDQTLVSIVMPTYNRADLLPRAIASIQGQTHQKWELIIVDDGSTDTTSDVLERFTRDPRLRVIWADHSGVSGARNLGLDAASGDYIAFLDTDNEWTPDHLRLLLTHLTDTGADSAYSAMVALDADGKVTSYLSADFDWNECFEGNYVDMNVFMHRRGAGASVEDPLKFETQLRRMVDWDYILRMTHQHPSSHAAFVGCRYHDVSRDDRITRAEPLIYRKMVQQRNDPKVDQPPTFDELAAALQLEFAIRISSPWAKRHVWGDTHYAIGLQTAIEKLGHKTRIVYHDDDESTSGGSFDEVNLVIRGLTPHGPIPGAFNILWVISHPEKVSPSEMAGYNIVYVASDSHAALLQHDPKVSPRTLLQATAFEPEVVDEADGGIVFVGNSRNVQRPIVEWAVHEALDFRLYGSGWDGTTAEDFCLGSSFPNDGLPGLYGSADAVLNDHWLSMREFGYISNRIFDVLASDGKIISDPIAALDRFFGDAIAQVDGPAELSRAVAAQTDDEQRKRVAQVVRDEHSFDARARQIVNDIFGYLHLRQPFAESVGAALPWHPAATGPTLRSPVALAGAVDNEPHQPLAVGALFMRNAVGYQSSAYIRVLSPLTADANFANVRVVSDSDPHRLAIDSLDALVIGRTALSDLEAAKQLMTQTRDAGVAVVVDVDDSFGSITPGTSEYELYQPRLEALRYVVESADAVSVSTPGIAEAFDLVDDPRVRVVANTLDPRWWRRYPRPGQVAPRDPKAPIRALYMGTATHDEDFEVIVEALDEWASADDVELTIIGAVRNPPKRPWLSTLAVPAGLGLYPRFVHWLVDQPQFDIGLAPLQDNEFNAGKSDIKFLDYCALGAVPVLSDTRSYEGDSHEAGRAYHGADTTTWLAALRAASAEVRSGARIDERRDWLWQHRSAHQAGKQLLDLIQHVRSPDVEKVAPG